ncbi:serine carboxypeptidase S28-domain-containing protein [Gongronella butleri]|nr:serine carboxypeptidase S28-domain-containing protein [Gongronella butleri]
MTPTANPFNDFCAIFDNTKSVHDEIEAYAGYISELVKSFCKDKPAVKCIDSHDPRNNMYTDENDDNRPWMYQVCTEYAYWQTANVPWRPTIVSRMLTPNWYQRQCPYFFGEHTVPHRPAWRYTNQHYDGWHIKMNRTYFLDGEWDPWRTLSVQSKDAPAVPTDVDAKYVVLPRAVHHWDFFVTDTVDDSIKELHKDLVDTMRRWLKEEDTTPTKPTVPSNVIEQLHRPFIYQSPLSQQ